MSKPKKPASIFALVSEDNSVMYFKDLKLVQQYMERENLEEATIFEVVAVIEASYPPEPELEFTDRELSSML